ncbi:hypothetical protein FKX85_11415 [Echinicola soli]|uniref:Lipoprotein n=1 Tax=Echinicola soli TaxID=2591634 RepID=A0A514CIG5_9BACT|nr:hypothetical protein [Echinicola soli]QDH79613.1 hypothetical protein FKX85_11415 [Echinicola soli]
MRPGTTILYLLLLWAVLAGCNTEGSREFVWEEEIVQLTGKDLGKWLRQAPFSNELAQTDKDRTVLTNAKQVFPFMARYKSAVGELENFYNHSDNPIYQQETVLYQDPQWGDLFVNATLLYDHEEVFLDYHYSEMGNPVFDGISAVTTYSASLLETQVFAQTAYYKTGLYWAQTLDKRYLLGFYQKGKLVFEVAVPLNSTDTVATLAKLKAVNEKLELHIPEWKNASEQQLKAKGTRDTFWKNLFMGIYMDKESTLNKVYLKVKDTPFQLAGKIVKGDYYFSYEAPNGKVALFTVLKETALDQKAFITEHKQLLSYQKNGQTVYYEEQQDRETIEGKAFAYYGPGKYLEINYGYPKTDQVAKTHVHGILKNIKIRKHL